MMIKKRWLKNSKRLLESNFLMQIVIIVLACITMLYVINWFFEIRGISTRSTEESWIGERIPDTEVVQYLETNRQTKRLSEFQGKVVMLNFWANWCEACLVEMPSILELYKKYQSQG